MAKGPGIVYPGSTAVLKELLGLSHHLHTNDLAAPRGLPAAVLLDTWPQEGPQPDLIFLDPSYTGENDWDDLRRTVRQALEKWPDACVVYWSMSDILISAPAKRSLTTTYANNGRVSSMCVYNPPDMDIRGTMRFLTEVLGGGYSVTFRHLEFPG